MRNNLNVILNATRLVAAPCLIIFLACSRCLASAEEDMKTWKERVDKVKAGMTLAEAERLMPLFKMPSLKPVAAYTVTLRNGTSISDPGFPLSKYHTVFVPFGGGTVAISDASSLPLTITSGPHCLVQYHVAPEILVCIDYTSTGRGGANDQDGRVNNATIRYEPATGTK